MSVETVRILAFVNHIAPVPGIEADIAQAFEWGVDVVVAQGTGSDWGPYWLGSGEQVSANQAANVEPYVAGRDRARVPFVFSFGIAGANPISTPASRRSTRSAPQRVVAGRRRRPVGDRQRPAAAPSRVATGRPRRARCGLSPATYRRRRGQAERIVALIGPEPVMAALDRGVDGVDHRTCARHRSLHGAADAARDPDGVAAFAGKLLECGGLALEPGDSGGRSGPVSTRRASRSGRRRRTPEATIRSLVSHTFYERSHPTQEENPGGLLDLADATYVETQPASAARGPLGRGALHRADGGGPARGVPGGEPARRSASPRCSRRPGRGPTPPRRRWRTPRG